MTDLQAIADQILAAARNGARIFPGHYIHRQLIDEMGGTQAWEALKADLALADKEFSW